MLTITAESAAAIAAHAIATYPDECVGLLLGRLNGTDKQVVRIIAVENRWEGQVALAEQDDPTSRRDRFYLDPRDYLRADRAAQAAGLEVVGCYHSHPDHPPDPSERDRVGAQAIAGPSFAFVIQSVYAATARDVAAWLLVEDGSHFVREELVVGGTKHA
ncbi:MAG: M67 family peptidase [Candidatus Viridilinea halotolerans]|uniref:M67 family peptidase n=1 Tax=Candidatus Viridilinea halotolerans TaxID=2491704 RepID=A0A426TZN7_9CHLR|nr:MAG: M67 family peptidase [Candidatus Viridilinea halotolerans]